MSIAYELLGLSGGRDYVDYMFDCQELRWAAEDEAYFATKHASRPTDRCGRCGYLLTATGHAITCGDTP